MYICFLTLLLTPILSQPVAQSSTQADIISDEKDITDLQTRIETINNASPDPIFQTAIDAAIQANETVKADIEEKDMWRTVLDKLIASNSLWGNMSQAEGEMKLNASFKTMNEGEKLAGEREQLDALRKAVDTGKENIQVSKLSDSILDSSTQLKDSLEHLRKYEAEYGTTKEQFQSSLLTIHELFQQLERAAATAATATSTPEETTSIKTDITTKQGLARAQKDRLVSLNATISEQNELIKTLHDHINRIVSTKTYDNATTPSSHTRAMEAKLNVMEHLIMSMSGNISMESNELLQDKDNEEKMNTMESAASTKTESLKGKSEKAAAQYANASATLAIDMKVEESARTTYEEGKAVDDAQRNSAMNKLKADIKSKEINVQLDKDKLQGEIDAEKTANEAAKAEDAASDAIKQAEEMTFQNKEKEMMAEYPSVEDNVAPWADEPSSHDSAAKIRHIVSGLLWSEGHSESAKAASMDIVNAVHGYDSKDVNAQDAATTKNNEKKLRGSHDTKHLDAKRVAIQATIDEENNKKKEETEKEASSQRFKKVTSTTQHTAGVDDDATSVAAAAATTSAPMPTTYTKIQSTALASVKTGIAASSVTSDLSIGPALKSVPETCFDGMQDGKEQGIDCGGDCSRNCGLMTTYTKHDSNTYHPISIVPRQTDIVSELQKKKEGEDPKLVKTLPAEIVARSQRNAKAKAAVPTTVYLPGEDGTDRVVEGEWTEVADTETTAFVEKKFRLRSQ